MAEEVELTRKVTFRVCVGVEQVQDVKVCIYDPDSPQEVLQEIQCQDHRIYGLWSPDGAITLPNQNLLYRYRIDVANESTLLDRVKRFGKMIFTSGVPVDVDHEPTVINEHILRDLPVNVNNCRDIFKQHDKIPHPESAVRCLRVVYIQSMLEGATAKTVKGKLLEMEHTWRSLDEDFLRSPGVKTALCDLLKECLPACTHYQFKLVILGVLYGKIAQPCELELGKLFEKNFVSKAMLKAFESIQADQLTSWSLSSLQVTAMQILEATGKNHWIFASAHFPFLFEQTRVLELQSELAGSCPHPDFVKAVLIPKIMEGYIHEEACVILKDIDKVYKTSEQADQLRDLILKLTMPQEGSPFQLKTLTLGSSATSEDQAAETAVGGAEADEEDHTLDEHEVNGEELQEVLDNPFDTAGKQQASEEVEVRFQLLVNDKTTSHAYLILLDEDRVEKVKMKLSEVRSKVLNKGEWMFAEVRIKLPKHLTCGYRYAVRKTQKGSGENPSFELEETFSRSTTPPGGVCDVFLTEYDVTHEEDKNRLRSQAAFFYANLLFWRLSEDNFDQSLEQIVKHDFPATNARHSHKKEVLKWIQRSCFPRGRAKIYANFVTKPQRKFLAAILGRLLSAGYEVNENDISEASRHLLTETLQNSPKDDFPLSVQSDVANACVFLARTTTTSWLSVWFYFYRSLDAEDLLAACQEVSAPGLREKTWKTDEASIKYVLEKLESDNEKLEKFFECCIGHIEDRQVFKHVLEMCASHHVDTTTNISKAATQLHDIINKRYIQKLEDLVKLWNDNKQTDRTQIKEVIRQHIIRFLSQEEWDPTDGDTIRSVIRDHDLFEDKDEILVNDVVTHITDHFPEQYACDMFVDMMRTPTITGSMSSKTVMELFEKAIEGLEQSLRSVGSINGGIKTVYKLLLVSRMCHKHLSKGIESKVYQIIKNVPIEALVEAMCKESTLQLEELCIMSGHIKRRILDDDGHVGKDTRVIMEKLLHVDGKLHVDSNPYAEVMTALLDVQEPITSDLRHRNKHTNFETDLLRFINNGDFWLNVFTSVGELSDSLRNHGKTKSVVAVLRKFKELMSQGKFTIDFARQIRGKREEVFLQLMSVAFGSTDAKCHDHLKVLHELETQFQLKIDCLCALIDTCVDGLSPFVQLRNIGELTSRLRLMQVPETLQRTLLTDTQNDDFWDCLTPVLPVALQLQGVASSITFVNVCRSVVDDSETYSLRAIPTVTPLLSEDASGSVGKDQGDFEMSNNIEGASAALDTSNRKQLDADSFAKMLKESCVPGFEQFCQECVFSENLDIPISFLRKLMNGIVDQKSLQEEMETLSRFFNKQVPPNQLNAIQSLVLFPELSQRLKQLEKILETFRIAQESANNIYHAINVIGVLKTLSEKDQQCNVTLGQLHEALKTVLTIQKDLKEEDWDIIEQLADSRELVSFLYPLVDEDLRNLIDAVEERSEQQVNESTVSDLIDVKRYLEPLLRLTGGSAADLVKTIKGRGSEHGVKHIANKINTCQNNVHSLRDLYNNVANRGEMTKEIVRNAMESGVYVFKVDPTNERCRVQLKYRRGTSEAVHGLDQLHDLRSRALLLANSRDQVPYCETEQDAATSTPLFRQFVKCIDIVNEIVQLSGELVQSGHFNFREFEETVSGIEQLDGICTSLRRQFEHWRQALGEAREKYYFLNFFHSKQLWQLDQFFVEGMETAILSEIVLVFKLIDIGIEADDSFRDHYVLPSERNNITARLFHLGEALQKIANSHTLDNRRIPGMIKSTQITVDTKVIRGMLFVAELEKESTKSIPVLLRLYYNTTGFLPDANQVVFCHANTSWEEIDLMLKRCIDARKYFDRDKLYSLVNVELLSTEVQFQLVKTLKDVQKTHNDFLLCLLCRGGSYHHIIDQFSPQFTHRVQGLTYAEMNSCLRTGWPTVEVVTSSQPGLGKTEYIKKKANESDLGVSTLPISGPVNKDSLVRRLKDQIVTPYQVLHLDVAPLSDPGLLDTFLFELIVLGMAVSGTHLCKLPVVNIAIEVANTYHDKLRNALPISSSLARKHLKWSGFSNFVVSQDPNSPIQVVCHYLQALGDNYIDTKDISLVGRKQVDPLSPTKCRLLLCKYFADSAVVTYTLIHTFLAVLAQELRRMSASLYFTPKTLKDMLGDSSKDVRSNFVRALIEVSHDFTARAVKQQSCDDGPQEDASEALHNYRSSAQVSADQMVARVQGMVKWAESNHLLLVFHRQDSQTVSALYRLLSNVPSGITKLFETQMRKNLRNYHHLTQDELQNILEKVVRSTRVAFQREKLEELETNYALTPDNLLKMVLIHMRIKVRIPVIIMGETGCGKTTLVTYLARVCEVSFDVLNLHAGTSEDDINRLVISLIHQAESNMNLEHWGFLDEINTCDHLGLLNEIICHRSFQGEPLPPNLFFLGACNPYRLREHEVASAGLDGKKRHDELSRLVYRVHPLPETMMDYVWDYGSLDKEDEEAYIRRMLEGKTDTYVQLVIMSQEFMRTTQKTSYCVSLRDVNRYQHLEMWFMKMYKTKKRPEPLPGNERYCRHGRLRSVILALTHCYYSRLTKPEKREEYKERIAVILRKNSWQISGPNIDQMIQAEQLFFLNRMHLPEGTAKNEALRENVFVILVSILNRIPVFVVGMPGCSKSLSMQLIRSELKGPDSKDDFFKTLPSLYVVSYQGSESSTSEGISKVFEKAKNYKKQGVMPVVLLDEIGLAEVSSFNPLKVLHSLLEPTVGGFPPVAVVGISNWALDAAKMNRAIHLSRPEPSIVDLERTALSIRDASCQLTSSSSTYSPSPHAASAQKLRGLAEAYNEYRKKQKHQNFHGLRDYYSLVKYIAMQSSRYAHQQHGDIIARGIMRNFGGLTQETRHILDIFTEKMNVAHGASTQIPVMELIQENLNDKHARHLMLITNGDSALDILERTLLNREHVILFGSHFENDNSEEYKYKILSEIILCMERDVVLVLRDLESIYGSLYDMLNQNYTWVGKKRNCRVALGPNSNPMCHVHDDFRCVVLVDENKVDYQNPPFLNRFEKQTLRFSDILTENQTHTIKVLDRWVHDIAEIEGYQFSREQMFLGIHDDTLRSLVYWRSNIPDRQNDDFGKQCQDELLKVACPDGVLRASKSKLAARYRDFVMQRQRAYFALPQQNGLKHFLDHLPGFFRNRQKAISDAQPMELLCWKFVIFTHSSIHTNIKTCLEGASEVQVETLSSFKSEQSFINQVRHFWFESSAELLVLQCMPTFDAATMLLAKCRIDQYRKEYLSSGRAVNKHVCLIVHIDRGQESEQSSLHSWNFNFLSGWAQCTLDSLQASSPSLNEIIQRPLPDLFSGIIDLDSIIKEQLLWCFGCMKYEDKTRQLESAVELSRLIAESPEFVSGLRFQILRQLRESKGSQGELAAYTFDGWQIDVACQVHEICGFSTLTGAMMDYIKSCVRIPLAKTLILLENLDAWTGSPINCIEEEDEDVSSFWQACFRNAKLFNIKSMDIPEPRGVESCLVHCNFLHQKFPFFQIFHRIISSQRDWLLNEELNAALLEEGLSVESVADRLLDVIKNIPGIQHEDFIKYHVDEYLDDLYNMFSLDFALHIPEEGRLKAMRWLVENVGEVSSSRSKNRNGVEVLANKYAALWMHSESIVAQLQLMVIYQDIDESNLDSLISRLQKPKIDDHDTRTSAHASNLEQDIVGFANVDEGADDRPQSEARETIEIDSTTADKKRIPITAVMVSTAGLMPGVDLVRQEEFEDIGRESVTSEDRRKFTDHDDKSTTTYQETPQTILVTEVCRSVLSVASNLQCHDEMEEWQRKASRVLLFAGKVSMDSYTLHFLRLCRNFAVMLNELNFTHRHLQMLSEKGMHAEDPLETEDVFGFVIDTVYELMAQGRDSSQIRKLEEFLCQFFGFCLSSNLDTLFLPQIIETLRKKSGELFSGARPVLLDILKGEITSSAAAFGHESDDSPPIYDQVIITTNLGDDFGNLTLIDDVLKECDETSHLPIACCDIIEDVAFGYVTQDLVGMIRSEEDQAVKTASESYRIINSMQGRISLKVITAAAYLRSFFRASASLLQDSQMKSFQLDGDHVVLVNVLNSLFRTKDTTELPLKMYFLKCLRRDMDFYSLRKWCTDALNPLPFLTGLKWQGKLFATRLGYNPMSYVDHYREVFAAITKSQVRKDTTDLLAFIDKARSSAEHRLGLLAATAEIFYFVQTACGLTDTDKSHCKWLLEQTAGFPMMFTEFLKRLVGLRDFDGFLQISDSTDGRRLEVVSVIIHMISIAISRITDDTTSLLTALTELKDQNFHSTIQMSSPRTSSSKDLAYYDCKCGYRVMYKQRSSLRSCPFCGKPTDDESVQIEESDVQNNQNGTGRTSADDQVHHHLSPRVSWTTKVLVKCGILAKDSLQSFSTQSKYFLAASHGDSSAEAATTDMMDRRLDGNEERTTIPLEEAVSLHWNELVDVVCVDHEGVTLFMHCILRALTAAKLDLSNSQTAELQPIIEEEIKKLPQNLADLKRTCFRRQGLDLDSMEAEIEEIDDTTRSLLTKLFRMRRGPSFSDFRARLEFAVYDRPASYSFPFLQLYFRQHEIIQYVKYLPNLLKWNATVTSQLTNRIKRDGAKRMKVVDFLDDRRHHLTEHSKAEASQAFNDFKEAWNNIRDGWCTLKQEEPDFERMTAQSTIDLCIVARNESGNCLQRMIHTLQSVQNSFLMESAAIATQTHCPALSFLVESNGVAVIKRTPLRSAKSAIIDYKWSDEILQSHDIDTEYGQGCVIDYKFNVMERELARLLVLNKNILAEGSVFSQFAYSDDMFHACSIVLAELGTSIPQEQLSEELVVNIKKEQGRRHTFAKETLEHLEMILVLLKKTSGDPEGSLQDFVKRWPSHLPGHFPEDMLPPPSDAVKLKHVVHLYEILEDLLTDGVLQNIRDEFRQDLPSAVVDTISNNLKPCNVDQLNQLASTLRRFIFRFLRASNMVESSANLKEAMVRSYGADSGHQTQLDLIPDGACIGHVMKITDFIKLQVEKRDNLTRKKDASPAIVRSRTVTPTRPSRRRRGGNVLGGVS